eukprot:UN14322
MEKIDGKWKKTSESPKLGAWTCYLDMHPSGNYLFTANYGSGTLSAIKLDEKTGAITKTICSVKSPNPPTKDKGNKERQEAHHGHCALSSRDGKQVFFCGSGFR